VKLFQSLVNQIKDAIDTEFGIIDETGLILGCSDEKKVGQIYEDIDRVIEDKKVLSEIDGFLFQKIYMRNKLEFIVYIKMEGDHSKSFLSLIATSVINIRTYHEEKFDKANFLKMLITGNVLPGDVLQKAKELHIANDTPRAVFLIRTDNAKEVQPDEVLKGLFPDKSKDFVISLDEEEIVLVKEMKPNEAGESLRKIAVTIIDTLNAELMVKAKVGIGSIVDNVRDLVRSFKEAQTALLIGNIFESDKSIVDYNNLGIGRLIYQLPTTLCKLFLNEVFKEGSLEQLDQETLFTIQKFFENSLNISETSRQLYVHRNTLVYRLDKIMKITGLDLRKFDDAVTFKVSMLVKKYLDNVGRDMP